MRLRPSLCECMRTCLLINPSNLRAKQPLEKCCGGSIRKAASKLQRIFFFSSHPCFSSFCFVFPFIPAIFDSYCCEKSDPQHRIPFWPQPSSPLYFVCSEVMACEGEWRRSQLECTKSNQGSFLLNILLTSSLFNESSDWEYLNIKFQQKNLVEIFDITD